MSADKCALAHVARRAADCSHMARSRLARVLARHGRPESLGHTITQMLAEHARVTLSFHPDRVRRDGLTVAQGLLGDGVYRSQFETGVTNGSPTAFAGGDRDRWEERLFAGAYQEEVHRGLTPERPKYGAFNVMSHSDGGSPRFGSCYFELSREALSRCTFTWGDSHDGPEHTATIEHFEVILAECLEAVEMKGSALGVSGLDVPTLVHKLSGTESLRDSTTSRPPGRALDEYIEAQVHGLLELSRDVDALVIDPAFDGTETGEQLFAIGARYGITVRRHTGFVLEPAEVPCDFRGPRMPALAERISGGSEFDAATLGRAAQALSRDPSKWRDWGTEAEAWQHIKQLWHVLVRFGRAHNGDARPTENCTEFLVVGQSAAVPHSRRAGPATNAAERRLGSAVDPCYVLSMSRVAARYEQGVLRPAKALPLQPGELVTVIVLRQADPARWDLSRLAGPPGEDEELSAAGLQDWARGLDGEDSP